MSPKVTVGVPVFNGAKTIRKCLDSIIYQTFTDFELIIADNASTDDTESICKEYQSIDNRIKYVRHSSNMGGGFNLRFLVEQASGEYFMWAAVDDFRSLDFLAIQVAFLDANPTYVSSTSPTSFEGKVVPDEMMGDWGLSQPSITQRLIKFFSCWHANAHFYGLHRKVSVSSWPELYGGGFHGADWTFVMHLASLGKINRAALGWVKLGAFGVSAKDNLFALYRKNILDYLIPFHKTSRKAIKLATDAKVFEYFQLVDKLIRFNANGFRAQRDHDAWDRRIKKVIQNAGLDSDQNNDFVICGAGFLGQRLYGSLSLKGIDTPLFTDKSLCGTNLNFDDVLVPVVSIESALEKGFRKYIIASQEFADEIAADLEMKAIKMNRKIKIIRVFD